MVNGKIHCSSDHYFVSSAWEIIAEPSSQATWLWQSLYKDISIPNQVATSQSCNSSPWGPVPCSFACLRSLSLFYSQILICLQLWFRSKDFQKQVRLQNVVFSCRKALSDPLHMYWFCENKLTWKPVKAQLLGPVTVKTNRKCGCELSWQKFLLLSKYIKESTKRHSVLL